MRLLEHRTLVPLLILTLAQALSAISPEGAVDSAIVGLDSIVREADICLPDSRRCPRKLRSLLRRADRVAAADTRDRAIKLASGLVRSTARFDAANFDADWLDRLQTAIDGLVSAASQLAESDVASIEAAIDPYGSPLGRFEKRVDRIDSKLERATATLEDGSPRTAARFLSRVASLHRSAMKLQASIDAYIDRKGLVIEPESDLSVLLYENPMTSVDDLADWVMEGAGEVTVTDGWTEIRDPERSHHHVFWCPEDFPSSFAAEWEVQNLDTRAGLLIVFFAATGRNGEDIFDESLPPRGGAFDNYIRGAIDNYHVSYYANTPSVPDRPHSRLRKNRGFRLLQSGEKGIPADSEAIHAIRLVKDGRRIKMFVDGREIIDYTDLREPLGGGKIGFRQMQWSWFRYRNFRVWGAAE